MLFRGLLIGAGDRFPLCLVMRHEQVCDTVLARTGQRDALLRHLFGEEPVRKLDQDSGAVAGLGVCANRAPVFQVAEDLQSVQDDLAALLVPDRADHSDAAGVMLVRRIVQTFGAFQAVVQRCGTCI